MNIFKERTTRPTNQEILGRYRGFPKNLTYKAFNDPRSGYTPEARNELMTRNPIIRTDTYNRTMEHLKGNVAETYVLQMRASRYGYLITAGIEDSVRKLAQTRITQNMLDFANEYYKHVKDVTYFNPQMWQDVIDKHNGYLPFTIDCVPDGTAMLPSDPFLRISGPGELVAHFEPQLHEETFYPIAVATNAHEIAQSIGADRFIEVGLRGALSDSEHLRALKAAYIGGWITKTSNDEAPG